MQQLPQPSYPYSHSQPQPQPQHKYFCFLLVRSLPTSIFAYVYLVFTCIFLVYLIKQMNKLKNINNKYHVLGIFVMLAVWNLTTLGQIGFSQYMYYQIPNQQKYPQQKKQQYSAKSFILFFLTFYDIFLLNTALFMALYNWHRNIAYFMTEAEGGKAYQSAKRDITLMKFCKYYLYVRSFILVGWAIYWILEIVIGCSDEMKKNIAEANYLGALVDSAVLLVGFVFGFVAIYKNWKLVQIIDLKQLKKIKFKYKIIIFTTCLRVFIFFMRNPLITTKLSAQFLSEECGRQKEISELVSLLMLGIQAIVMDFIPACIILNIYKIPGQEQQTKQQSLSMILQQ